MQTYSHNSANNWTNYIIKIWGWNKNQHTLGVPRTRQIKIKKRNPLAGVYCFFWGLNFFVRSSWPCSSHWIWFVANVLQVNIRLRKAVADTPKQVCHLMLCKQSSKAINYRSFILYSYKIIAAQIRNSQWPLAVNPENRLYPRRALKTKSGKLLKQIP